ncbi:MAG: LPS export ABC transporter periplasmic protein LptC [Candidatus Omnitrophica bacterium]|nr:LPS export ABC transporter periplasmic protein LptC [Candidatus Omnitrophota bacterium]
MSENKKNNLWALFLLIMVLASAVSAEEELSPEPIQPDDDSHQEIWNFSLSGHDPTGSKRWEVSGDTADIFSDAKIGLTGVKATSFSPTGSFTLNSKKGTFDKIENNIELKEEVVAQSSDGTTFKSDHLDYRAETGEIKTDAFVEIEQKQMRTFGYGAKAEPGEKKLQLEKNITVIANPSTTITCKGPLEVDYKNQIAVFENDVRVVDPRGEIISDRMEVQFNKELETIQKVIATGNVRITQGENVTRSDRAEYDVQEGKVTLSQQPQLQVVPQ